MGMPRTKSAKKALKQSVRRRRMNLKHIKETQTAIKQFKKLVAAGKKEEAQKHLPQVYKKLDKLAKTKFIKKGRASRLKSRLSKKLQIR